MPNNFDLPTEGCENEVVAPGLPCATHNVAVQSIDALVFRLVSELRGSNSARINGISAKDKVRFTDLFDRVVETAELLAVDDTDSHYLILLKLTDVDVFAGRVENEAVNTAVRYIMQADLTLRNCNSTRINDGLSADDLEDFLESISKAARIIKQADEGKNPLDLPLSSPSRAIIDPASV